MRRPQRPIQFLGEPDTDGLWSTLISTMCGGRVMASPVRGTNSFDFGEFGHRFLLWVDISIVQPLSRSRSAIFKNRPTHKSAYLANTHAFDKDGV